MSSLLPLVRPRAVLWGALALGLLLAGCATSSDVEELQQANTVQDRRIAALEQSTSEVIQREFATLRQEMQQARQEMQQSQERRLNAMEGRLQTLDQRVEQLTNEQKALTTSMERTVAKSAEVARNMEQTNQRMAQFRVEQAEQVDALRVQLAELEKMLQSPIANLPSRTAADQDWREAFYLLISGQLDLAAQKFAAFRNNHPGDERVVASLFHEGQAYFLLRQYDRALIPFFQLADEHPQHRLVTDAKWLLARSLEETGDLQLAREFYAQLVANDTKHKTDATRRIHFIDTLYPRSGSESSSETAPAEGGPGDEPAPQGDGTSPQAQGRSGEPPTAARAGNGG